MNMLAGYHPKHTYKMTEENQKEVQMKFYDHIGVAEGLVTPEYCDTLIQAFEEMYAMKYVKEMDYPVPYKQYSYTEGDTQFDRGGLGRKDHQLFLETADITMATEVNQAVGQAFEMYAKEYKGILDSADPVSSWTVKLQRTDPGGGYHIWHCENGSFAYRDRVLTWMIYLNDIPPENGGGTDFYHQKRTFHPTKGTVVLWPACYTHMHRGAFLTGENSKYIATGWFYREPGNVTNRIIGEKMGELEPENRLNE